MLAVMPDSMSPVSGLPDPRWLGGGDWLNRHRGCRRCGGRIDLRRGCLGHRLHRRSQATAQHRDASADGGGGGDDEHDAGDAVGGVHGGMISIGGLIRHALIPASGEDGRGGACDRSRARR